MAWLKIDDGFNENPKIENLKDRAFRVHVSGLVYCAKNLTDGYLSNKSLKILSVLVGFNVTRHVSELVEARLWRVEEDGYRVNDYLKYNPDAESVRKLREERSAAGKRGAKKRWANDNGDDSGQWQEPDQLLDAPAVVVPVPARNFLKAVTADQEIEVEVDKIMRSLTKFDDDSRDVIVSFARKLPLRIVAKVRESCELKRNAGAGYAINALKSELAEIEEVA